MYIYHKLVAKNGGQKLTAHIRSGIYTYRLKKMEATFHCITISYSLFLNRWYLYFDLNICGKSMKVSSCLFSIIFMWICHLFHSDLSPYSCGFAFIFVYFFTSGIQICRYIHVDLL